MKAPARLIIPLWGEAYASKLATMTLPALLAPGNLPALAGMFDVELVLVTETKLFDKIREAGSFQELARLCRTRFVSLDDLMTDLPGDYGVVLTYALFRGFADLGDAHDRHLPHVPQCRFHHQRRVAAAPRQADAGGQAGDPRTELSRGAGGRVAEAAGGRRPREGRARHERARHGQARAHPQARDRQGPHRQSTAVPPAVDGPVLLVRR